MDQFDLVVIGGGTGGYTAAIHAAQAKLKVAIVERDKIGGTCLHRGCIPTKAWLESSETLVRMRAATALGVNAGDISFDFPTMVQRQMDVVEILHKSIRSVIQKHGIEIIEGQASFKSSTQIAIGDRMLTTRCTVIATGSQPRAIPGLEPDGVRIMTSDHILKLGVPPKSIAIIGAGAIGCEFSTFFQEIGTEVTLIEMLATVLPLEDPDVGKALGKIFESRGVNVLTSARVLADKTRSYDGVVELTVEHAGEEKQITAESVLVAVGREAVTEGLGLENTKVTLDRGYIKIGESYITEDPDIYAIGDANGGLLLVHVAGAEGEIAAAAITGHPGENLDLNRVPRITYSHPPVASVGMTEQQAKEAGHNAKSARYSFRGNAMALIKNDPEGFAKVVYDADSGDLLGAFIIGHSAGELISEVTLARFLEASAWEIGANIHPHPALSEALGDAAQIAAGTSIYR